MIEKLLTLLMSALVAMAAMSAPARAQTLADPCSSGTKINVAMSETAPAIIVPGMGTSRIYVCFLFLASAGAQNISLVEGSGTVCVTNQAVLIGGPGGTGPPTQASGSWALGSGAATITFTATPGDDVCLLQSLSGLVAGNMIYVRQ